MRAVLDLFCGVGGWSKAFSARGWRCVGVDLCDLGYPFEFVKSDVFDLSSDWMSGFDAVVASPPCEDFARAWLPWLRGDKSPDSVSLELLSWSVSLCDRPRRLVECSNFAARHVPGSLRFGSYSLWGDVPLLIPHDRRRKTAMSGKRPDLRAEIPLGLSSAVEWWFRQSLEGVK